MATANAPPQGHLLQRLLAMLGEDGTRRVLVNRPGFAISISRHAQACTTCGSLLVQVFPDGVPEHNSVGDITEADLERIFRELSEGNDECETLHLAESPGSEPRGGSA